MSAPRNMPEFICAAPLPKALQTVTQALNWIQADGSHHSDGNLNVALIWVDDGQGVDELRRQYPLALLLGSAELACAKQLDFALPGTLQEKNQQAFISQILQQAEKFWRSHLKVSDLARDVGLRRQRMSQLSQISLALTAQISEQELLQTLLTEARKIAHCEGGSLFLVETDTDKRHFVSLQTCAK